MTKEWLRSNCRETGGYTSPLLNESLYLHFKGFTRIQHLEEYTAVRSIFLEGNGIEELDGLENCVQLRCLFAQQNFIMAISPTLPISITSLNVSYNNLGKLGNLARLKNLQTLSVGCIPQLLFSKRRQVYPSSFPLSKNPTVLFFSFGFERVATSDVSSCSLRNLSHFTSGCPL